MEDKENIDENKLRYASYKLELLRDYMEAICSIWDCPENFTMAVAIGNMNADIIHNYKENGRIYKYVEILEKLSTINPDNHVSAFIYGEMFGVYHSLYGYNEAGEKYLAKNKFNKAMMFYTKKYNK